jgi:hypothetical protein
MELTAKGLISRCAAVVIVAVLLVTTAGLGVAFSGAPTDVAPQLTTDGALDGGSVGLAWTESVGAGSYTVEYRLLGDVTWLSPAGVVVLVRDPAPMPHGGSMTVTGLTAGDTYEFRVHARSFSGVIIATSSVKSAKVTAAPTDIALSGAMVLNKQPVGTVVGVLSTTDPDSTGPFTYALVAGAGDTDNASFAVVGDSLSTAAVLDFAVRGAYGIRVRTTDSDGRTFEKEFTVSIAPPYGGTRVGRPWTRFVVRRKSRALVYGYLGSRHAARTYPVMLECYRLENGTWVLRETASIAIVGHRAGYGTKYAGYVRLPRRGRWKIVATHTHVGYPADESAPRYFWVR